MSQLSKIIFPLLVWNIDLYRSNEYKDFTLTQLCSIATTSHFRINDAEGYLYKVKRRADEKLRWLQSNFPGRKQRLSLLENEIKNLGITPQTTYLYIHGHSLFEKIVMPVMTSVCETLKREREDEISRLAVHDTQFANEIACYKHSVEEIASMLKKSQGYLSSPQVNQIRKDIETMDL